jgi:hypothetical protein
MTAMRPTPSKSLAPAEPAGAAGGLLSLASVRILILVLLLFALGVAWLIFRVVQAGQTI